MERNLQFALVELQKSPSLQPFLALLNSKREEYRDLMEKANEEGPFRVNQGKARAFKELVDLIMEATTPK